MKTKNLYIILLAQKLSLTKDNLMERAFIAKKIKKTKPIYLGNTYKTLDGTYIKSNRLFIENGDCYVYKAYPICCFGIQTKRISRNFLISQQKELDDE